MLYYLGKGTEFKKKRIARNTRQSSGASKTAAKNEELVVWDETETSSAHSRDNVPEGALETNHDGSVNTYDADGNKGRHNDSRGTQSSNNHHR